jgi:CDP-diacylglycerol--glycerol-3-phosphate 3-phosphatidyltransferase
MFGATVPRSAIQFHATPGLWPPTWPMGLTMLRLLLLPVFLWMLLLDARTESHRFRWLAVGIFTFMAITDKLDGYLARRLNQTSKIGQILDPIADKLLIACSVIVLSFDWAAPPGYAIPWPVVAAIYGKDAVVVLGTLALLAVVGKVTATPRPLGKLGTFLQLSMIIATLIAPDLRRFGVELAHWLTRVLWWLVGVVSVLSCIDYVIQGTRQFIDARKQPAAVA